MEKIKNNITLKYTIGLFFVTIIILSIQIWSIKLFNTLGFELTNISFLFSVIVLPLIGLYIVTNLSCKNNYNKISHLLTKIFIISIILTLCSAIYIAFKLKMFGNIDGNMLVISNGTADIVTKDIIDSYSETPIVTFILIANIKFILHALILSTIYIATLNLTVVRHWINKNIPIEKEETIKQIKHLLIIVAAIITVIVLIIVGLSITEGNIPMSMTIQLESQITNSEKREIENKLKGMNKIINYEYIDDIESTNEFKELFKERFDNLSDQFYQDIFSNINAGKFNIIVHNKNVDYIKKELEGMNGIKVIQGTSINF